VGCLLGTVCPARNLHVLARLAVISAMSGVVTGLAASPKTALALKPPVLQILAMRTQATQDARATRTVALAGTGAPLGPIAAAAAALPVVECAVASFGNGPKTSAMAALTENGSKTSAMVAPTVMAWVVQTVVGRPLLVGPA